MFFLWHITLIYIYFCADYITTTLSQSQQRSRLFAAVCLLTYSCGCTTASLSAPLSTRLHASLFAGALPLSVAQADSLHPLFPQWLEALQPAKAFTLTLLPQ